MAGSVTREVRAQVRADSLDSRPARSRRGKCGFAALLVVLATPGCESLESGSVMTQGLYADMVAQATGDGTTEVQAWLRVGGALSNVYVDLVPGDELVATVAGSSRTMQRKNVGDLVWYVAELAVDDEDALVRVALERADAEDAPDSRVTLPAPFELTAPPAGVTYSRASEPIIVRWAPSGEDDEIHVNVTGPCIDLHAPSVSGDLGQLAIPASTLIWSDYAADVTCTADITVARVRHGQLDPAYGEGGQIVAEQVRQVSFVTIP